MTSSSATSTDYNFTYPKLILLYPSPIIRDISASACPDERATVQAIQDHNFINDGFENSWHKSGYPSCSVHIATSL